MRTAELFCGTKSFSKVAARLGHSTHTIDNNIEFNPDVCADILEHPITTECFDALWASPPCTTFSVASIGKHWNKGYIPKTEAANTGLKLLDKTVEWIATNKPENWFIENPRGMMRKVIDQTFKKWGVTDYRRVTVTYCQYGDTRMKPTDVWTNNKTWQPRPMCKKGSPCHAAAPRGSSTGTQGILGNNKERERGRIPEKLFEEIFNSLEDKKVRM